MKLQAQFSLQLAIQAVNTKLQQAAAILTNAGSAAEAIDMCQVMSVCAYTLNELQTALNRL